MPSTIIAAAEASAMDSQGLDSFGSSGGEFLEPEAAREILFEKILDQLADSSFFSFDLSPTIFIVYAHNNENVGKAYDEYVRKLMTWLERVHARILSDQSPLPPFVSGIEGTDPIGNILGNQMCLLPTSCYGSEIQKVRTVDKVIVCSSEVMEGYYHKPSAQAYIEDIVQICDNSTDHHANMTLESAIRDRVEKECSRDHFHNVLTELAFLKVRKLGLTETQDMVPVVLSQLNPDEAPMRYLPVFRNTDVKFKLKSTDTASLHRLFLKLLKRLFPEDKEFIKTFEQCYSQVNKDVELSLKGRVIREELDNIVNQRVTEAYHEYWKISCVLMRGGKLQGYTGKLSDQVSQALDHITQSTQHDILEWLSPHRASKYHGIYHDSGTGRIQGTCDWVIQNKEFHRWHAYEGSALLFLCGNMGTGKTYSTSRVIDWIEAGLSTSNNDEGFAYFYCNKQDPARSDTKEILRNIIRQLATGPWKDLATNTAVHKSVNALFLKDHKKGILSTYSEWEACLQELIHTYPRTTIVLDALDECKTQQRQDLINLLVKLATGVPQTKHVKIFVAARPEDDIRQHLDKFFVIRMQEKQNGDDMSVFIREKIAQHSQWSSMTPEFRKHLVDTLVKKSQDMFLFASLQIDNLKDCWLEEDIRDGLKTLPATLTAAYKGIYQKATEKPAAKVFIDRALRWVMCAARPLTTDELLFAICQDAEAETITATRRDVSEGLISRLCHNLLSLEDSHGNEHPVWRLAHQAVAEFLERSTVCNSRLAHYESGKVCLMILLDTFGATTTDSRTITGTNLEHYTSFEFPCEPDRALDLNKEHQKLADPLAGYAVYGWPTHVRAQEDGVARGIDGLSQTLRKFLGQPEEASPAYIKWFKHAFQNGEHRSPQWSIFNTRRMPQYLTLEKMMEPTILACHLGLYTCLLDWWSSDTIDYGRISYSPEWWMPSSRMDIQWYYCRGLHWSLVALACVHNETNIIKHLLGRKVRINNSGSEEVPPIVAAAVADSVETVEHLIERRADICSTFTLRHGHVLSVAISSNSLGVLRLLLQQPCLSQTPEIEEVLKSCSYDDFKSADALAMLINMGVNVNTPLREGTLLLAAVEKGWETMMCNLLEIGAEVNAQTPSPDYQNAFEVFLGNDTARPWTTTLFMKYGAQVNSRTVAIACGWSLTRRQPNLSTDEVKNKKEILQLLLGCKPDLNETWIRCGRETTALMEAVDRGDLDQVQLLFAHGAKLNLNVEVEYGDPLGCVFRETLNRTAWDHPYPVREMIDALVEAGASLESLEGDRLHTALAAAAFAGLEEMVQGFLKRGASPYTYCDHKYRTALCAAAASDHPQAPAIIRALLNNDPDISSTYCGFFELALLALDCSLFNLISVEESERDHMVLLEVWLESACILAQHHAIWDIDWMQWNKCLKLKRPKFWEQNAEPLAKLKQVLEKNRTNFFLKFPGAASDKQWSIKDANAATKDNREILNDMYWILLANYS